MMISPAEILFIAVLGLFGIGLYGLLITRNLMKIFVVLQILVKSVVLAMVLAGHYNGLINLSQSLAATVIVADTIVAVIGLALAIQVQKRWGTLDLKDLASLKS